MESWSGNVLKRLCILPAFLTALLLGGCTAHLYDTEQTPIASTALIREGHRWNGAVELLEVDDLSIGDFRDGVRVLPGEHTLRMQYHWSRLMTDRTGDPITERIRVESGHTYEITGQARAMGARWTPQINDITESLRNPPPSGGWFGATSRFIGSRFLDVFDIGEANVTLGFGTGISIHPTRVLQVSLGGFSGLRGGWMGRRFPLKFDANSEAGISVLQCQARRPRDFWRIGAWLHLLVVGVEVGIDPPQIGDFFAGLAGFDPLRDDLTPPLPGQSVPIAPTR